MSQSNSKKTHGTVVPPLLVSGRGQLVSALFF
jgi:hypothetical protein